MAEKSNGNPVTDKRQAQGKNQETVESEAQAQDKKAAQSEAQEKEGKTAAGVAGGDGIKFKLEKLRENCMQLFHVTASTFDGAFYGHGEAEMSISEARATIHKWLGKE